MTGRLFCDQEWHYNRILTASQKDLHIGLSILRIMFSQAEEMMNRVFNTARGISPLTADVFRQASTFPYYYGYQITVGPDGKPHVREFGNVKPGARGLVEQSGVREPLVDSMIDEKNSTITITAEMPGLSKENIKVNSSDNVIIVHKHWVNNNCNSSYNNYS